MSADRFFPAASHCVSKRPIWVGEVAAPEAALPPTTQRIARIVAQALGKVHVLVSGEPPMTAVLPGACVGEQVTPHGAEAEGIIKFAIGQQSGIRGNSRAAILKH